MSAVILVLMAMAADIANEYELDIPGSSRWRSEITSIDVLGVALARRKLVDLSLLLARLFLAWVFATAGVAKLADGDGFRRTLTDFGLPASCATFFGLLLPLIELVVAVFLILLDLAWWGALLALALLSVFGAAIAVNLARGRAPDCRCFGQFHPAPVGRSTLVRNLALAAVAAFVMWEGVESAGLSAISWVTSLTVWHAAAMAFAGFAAIGIGIQGWFLIQLFRQHGRLLLRMDALERTAAGAPEVLPAGLKGLPAGVAAPSFRLPDLTGNFVALGDLLTEQRPAILIFVNPGCGPCVALLPELAVWQKLQGDSARLVLVSTRTPEENRTKLGEHTDLSVLLQTDWEVATTYRVQSTPAAVLVSSTGAIGSPLAIGPEAIRSLMARVSVERALPVLKLGYASPAVEAPDVAEVQAR
jgi:uncharacterized membrane protein YphA (DoxX/SURF4 family)/thiol-disulfide isomerase/thioredoxin